MAGDTEHVAELDVGVAVHDGVGVIVVARVVVFGKVVADQLAVVAVVVPIHVIVVVSNANAVRRFVVHVDVAAQQVVVLVLNRIVVKGGRPKRGSHEVVRRTLTAVGVGRFLSRAPLPVELGVVGAEGDGADLFEEVVAVGVLSVFRRLVVKTGVVNDGDAVSGPVGDPQLIGTAGMEFHVPWVVQIIGGVGDDRLDKAVTEGLHRGGLLGHRGVSRKSEQEHEHQRKGNLALHHAFTSDPTLLIPCFPCEKKPAVCFFWPLAPVVCSRGMGRTVEGTAVGGGRLTRGRSGKGG